jgi:hypothetical protein
MIVTWFFAANCALYVQFHVVVARQAAKFHFILLM